MENKKQKNEEIQTRRDFFKKVKQVRLLSKFAIMMIVGCLLSSCLSTTKITYVPLETEYQETFVGKQHNVIVLSQGAPDRQVSDGIGGTILIYEKTTTVSNSSSIATAYNVNYYEKTYTPGAETNTVTKQHTSYVHIFIDKDGVCYNVKTNHEKPVEEVDEEAIKRNKVLKKIGILWGGLAIFCGIMANM